MLVKFYSFGFGASVTLIESIRISDFVIGINQYFDPQDACIGFEIIFEDQTKMLGSKGLGLPHRIRSANEQSRIWSISIPESGRATAVFVDKLEIVERLSIVRVQLLFFCLLFATFCVLLKRIVNRHFFKKWAQINPFQNRSSIRLQTLQRK